MKTNKATSWSAAVFISSSCITLFAPLVYLIVLGKSEGQWNFRFVGIDTFSVDSHSSGGFGISYGVGVLLLPAILSVLVWGILLATAKKVPTPHKRPKKS